MEETPQNNQPVDREPRPNKTALVLGIIVIVLIVGYILVRNNNKKQPADNSQQQKMNDSMQQHGNEQSANPNQSSPSSGSASSEKATSTNETNTKVITVTGQNYSFSPAEIRVKKGDKVKIVFQNSGGFHDWSLDAFNVKTPTIPAGQTATVEFTASKTGTFEYDCSVGNHRAMGMKGKLIVE